MFGMCLLVSVICDVSFMSKYTRVVAALLLSFTEQILKKTPARVFLSSFG